jgi:hypothetical protein
MGRKDRNSAERPITIVRNEPEAIQEQVEDTYKPTVIKESFDQWWGTAEYRYKLNSNMKESVRKHFIARGFFDSGDWDVGIKDFGIRT